MNRFVCLALVFTCFLVTESAAAPAPRKVEESDLKKLEGDWTIESWVQFGQTVELNASWNFKGGKYTLDQGGGNVEEGELKLGKDKKLATMDLKITGGTCSGKDQLGIYKLDGDNLTLSFAWPDAKDRPTDFSSTADNKWILITLKRKK